MIRSALRPDSLAGTPLPVAASELRFNWVVERICRQLFSAVRIAPSSVEHLRDLAARGPLVYVMRQRSWVDYLLLSFVLKREGLPAPEFVNDLPLFWARPVPDMVRAVWRWLRGTRLFGRELRASADRSYCQRLVSAGRPVLLFLRARAPGVGARARGRRAAAVRTGPDYVREIVHHLWTAPGEDVSLVPIAVMRGRGMRRKESRLATLVYSVQEMPGELRRLISLLWNLNDTSLSVGLEVEVRAFTREYQREGEERIVRRLTRALQIFLYREERVVWGPLLLAKRQVRQRVMQDGAVRAAIRQLAATGTTARSRLWRQAERDFHEMAANFHGIYFAFLEFAFNRIWPKLFHGFESSGLERVIETVKRHPVVLVPCHRSHFDYLILSYLFHVNYLSPPHIAAGINLSFWPLGALFRGAGAYFIRRTFEGDDLYKAVFRAYLKFLIREGYTQEFFIEGGRSRTGKIVTPKLGMLSAIVDAFIEGARRDLFFVPVSIHYGRVVEEEEYQRELGGAQKSPESLSGLLRARRVLRRRHGTVYISFAEPISLCAALGDARERLRDVEDAEAIDERRRFVRKLGFRLLREVNAVAVAGATSVSATVLLSLPQPACRWEDFLTRAEALTRFLRARGVRFTPSLERNTANGFRENLAFLENGGLVQRVAGADSPVLHVPTEKRLALDFYKNNTIHFFLLAALVLDGLAGELRGAALEAEVRWWLDMLRWEFPLPERRDLASEIERVCADLREQSALSGDAGDAPDLKHSLVITVRAILDNFREAYFIAAQSARELPASGLSQRVLVERMQARYRAALLLGEVRKPEGNSSVTLTNALSRLGELEMIEVHGGKLRDRMVLPGPRFAELESLSLRMAASVAAARHMR
ncbi:MAG: 1-acyl-sn-glycerol-3-phosphate acyltransferase [Candidatus Binatia bacterium]